jgi:hypothetical protein
MLFLEATTRAEFHAAISDLSQAVLSAGGWVISHQFFSHARAVIGCEIAGSAVGQMVSALDAAGITAHPPAGGWPETDRDVRVQIALSFVGDGPDFRREVPAFG